MPTNQRTSISKSKISNNGTQMYKVLSYNPRYTREIARDMTLAEMVELQKALADFIKAKESTVVRSL